MTKSLKINQLVMTATLELCGLSGVLNYLSIETQHQDGKGTTKTETMIVKMEIKTTTVMLRTKNTTVKLSVLRLVHL